MNIFFIVMILLSMTSLCGMENNKNNFKFESSYKLTNKPKNKSKWIYNYYYTGHARDRMEERKIRPSDISYIIENNYRYMTLQDTSLVVDIEKQIGVIVDFDASTIITAIANFSAERLEGWLKDRDSATEEEKLMARQLGIAKREAKK